MEIFDLLSVFLWAIFLFKIGIVYGNKKECLENIDTHRMDYDTHKLLEDVTFFTCSNRAGKWLILVMT